MKRKFLSTSSQSADATSILGVPIDDTDKGDGKVLSYDQALKILKYVTITSGGGGTGDGFTRGSDSISSSSSKVVDSVSTSTGYTVNWLIDFSLEDQSRASTEITATRTKSGITHTEYAIVGDEITYNVDIQLNGSLIELYIENLEAEILNVAFIRIEVT